MTHVMGWDLSLDRTGIALPSGQLTTYHPTGDGDARLPKIEAALKYYVRCSPPDVVVIEQIPPSLRGGTITIVRLALVHAIARLVLAKWEIPYAYLPVGTLKKYATGSGVADKHQMINACLDHGIEPRDDNEADAAWLRIAGIHHYDRIAPGPAHALSIELLSGPKSRVKWPALP